MENYQNRQIVLTPDCREDGNWICEYVIVEIGHTAWPSTRGYPEGIFHSPNDARLAALLEAKTIINSRVETSKARKSSVL